MFGTAAVVRLARFNIEQGHEGKRYFYCESTGTGWRIGQIPDVYQGAKFRVIPILSQGNEGMK